MLYESYLGKRHLFRANEGHPPLKKSGRFPYEIPRNKFNNDVEYSHGDEEKEAHNFNVMLRETD